MFSIQLMFVYCIRKLGLCMCTEVAACHYLLCCCYYGCPIGRPLYFATVVSTFLLFFLTYSQRLQIGCLPYFHTWYGLSANL